VDVPQAHVVEGRQLVPDAREVLEELQRLARQRKRLENDMASRKKRIISIMDGYLPGVHPAFSSRWSLQAKAFLSSRLNPLAVVHDGEKALDRFLTNARYRHQKDANESHMVYVACQAAARDFENFRPETVEKTKGDGSPQSTRGSRSSSTCGSYSISRMIV
jgi:hypothetical protein